MKRRIYLVDGKIALFENNVASSIEQNLINNTYSMEFENDSYLTINNASNSIMSAIKDDNPKFTLSIWFNGFSDNKQKSIFSIYDRTTAGEGKYEDPCFLLSVDTSGYIACSGNYSQDIESYNLNLLSNELIFTAFTWNQIVVAYDSSKSEEGEIFRMFLNGVKLTSDNFSTYVVNTTEKIFYSSGSTPLKIGGLVIPSTYAGYIDEVTFWNDSLTDLECVDLYGGGKAIDVSDFFKYPSNCLAWYRMGDYTSDNWDSTKWNIINVKGTADTDLISVGMVEADRVEQTP